MPVGPVEYMRFPLPKSVSEHRTVYAESNPLTGSSVVLFDVLLSRYPTTSLYWKLPSRIIVCKQDRLMLDKVATIAEPKAAERYDHYHTLVERVHRACMV